MIITNTTTISYIFCYLYNEQTYERRQVDREDFYLLIKTKKKKKRPSVKVIRLKINADADTCQFPLLFVIRTLLHYCQMANLA